MFDPPSELVGKAALPMFMSLRERLHRITEEPSETQAEAALRALERWRDDPVNPGAPIESSRRGRGRHGSRNRGGFRASQVRALDRVEIEAAVIPDHGD